MDETDKYSEGQSYYDEQAYPHIGQTTKAPSKDLNESDFRVVSIHILKAEWQQDQ